MARKKSITSIENEITALQSELNKVQEKYDGLAAKLLDLQKQKREYEANMLMDAFLKSGKSFAEVMTFLDV